MKWIGRRIRPLLWEAQTSGRFGYVTDECLAGMLVGRILRSPHAHALIRSVDTRRASALPGVHAVVTAGDMVKGVRYIHEGANDRPPLADGVVRFIGQEVAAVAAVDAATADAALAAIDVHYEILRAPLTVDEALAHDAIRLHSRTAGEVPNVSRRVLRRWGDIEKGRAASSVSAEGRFNTPIQTHVAMEPNGSLAHWDLKTRTLHLWTGTQSPVFVCKEVAHVLGLRTEQIVCHETGIGGGFGGKSKVCEHEAISGALSRKALRPVRLIFSREEEFEATKTRHAFDVQLRIHADRFGRLCALEGKVVVDNGAYNHTGASVMGAGIKALGSLYRPDGLEVEGLLVDTAKQPGGSFRGYGSSQATFALESLMDELAHELAMDPIEFRILNANRPDSTALVGSRIQSARLVECLEAARDAIDWTAKKANRREGRGLGVGTGMHVCGSYGYADGNRSDGAVDLYTNGRVRLRFGGADTGTNQKTILAQIAAEELGVPVESIDVLSIDSEHTPYDQGAWGSRGTYFAGHAARLVTKKAAEEIKSIAAQRFGVGAVRLEDGLVVSGTQSLPFGEIVAAHPRLDDGVVTVEASFVESDIEMADKATGYGNISGTYSFGTHVAEVEADRKTGQVRIVDYVAVHDIGTVLNPTLAEGQTIGGAAMGIGGALREQLIHEQGKLVNPAFLYYSMPRAADLPRIRPILVPGTDPKAPYGAKGVGELGHTPAAPAIANAIFDALGVRIRDLPITPDKVLRALAEKEGRVRRHGLWRRPGRWWIAAVRWIYPRGLLRIMHRPAMRLASSIHRPPLEALEMPSSIDAALGQLGCAAMPIGGGTDLLPRRRQGLASPLRLVSLTDIPELKTLEEAVDGGLKIGAGVSLATLSDEMAGKLPLLGQAIAGVASAQVRAIATLGGNLMQAKRCWFYRSGFDCYKRSGPTAPCYAITGDHRFYHAAIDGHRCQAVTPSDLATALCALDAEAVIRGRSGQRVVSMTDFYTGPGETVVLAEELLVQIRLPPAAFKRKGTYLKLTLWEGDFAMVSVGVSAIVDAEGRWHDLRLAFGGLAPTPWRAWRTETLLSGTAVSPARLRKAIDAELDATAHPLPGNAWKLDAAAGLAERAVEALGG